VNILVLNGDVKLVLAKHDKVCKLDGIDTEICGKLGIKGNGVGINLELVLKDLLNCFELR